MMPATIATQNSGRKPKKLKPALSGKRTYKAAAANNKSTAEMANCPATRRGAGRGSEIFRQRKLGWRVHSTRKADDAGHEYQADDLQRPNRNI